MTAAEFAAEVSRNAAPIAAHEARLRAAKIESEGLETATGALVTKLTALNNELVSNQESWSGYQQTLITAREAMGDSKNTMNAHTQAGIDNRNSMLGLAKSAASVVGETKRMVAIKQTTKFISDWAQQAGWGKQKADDYANGLFNLGEKAKNLPAKAGTEVEVGGLPEAIEGLDRYRTEIANLPPVKVVTIQQRFTSTGEFVSGGAARPGDTIITRFAGGDVTAGTVATLNELGPETFVPRIGVPYAIGDGSPMVGRFSEAGYVVPAASTPPGVANPVPEWVQTRMEKFTNRPNTAAPPPLAAAPPPVPSQAAPSSSPAPQAPSSGTTLLGAPPKIEINLNGSNLSVADVEQASLAAYRRWQREMKERQ